MSILGVASARQVTFRTRTDAVSVNVSVKQGRVPVTNLTAADFALTDSGVVQKVEVLSLDRVPLDVTLVITGHAPNRDNTAAYLGGLTSASAVRQSLLPQDRLRVIWVHAEVRGGLVSSDVSLLAASMGVRRGQGISVIDGLFYAMAWPVERDRRHLIVAFTDGYDTHSTLGIEELPRLAAHADAVMHAVFWASPADRVIWGGGMASGLSAGGGNPQWEASVESVSEAVRRTGGMVLRASHAGHDLAAIVADFRTSYVLQYTPRGVPAVGWHEIRVRVTRPGRFAVRARTGYETGRE
jgi:hypothetical protein